MVQQAKWTPQRTCALLLGVIFTALGIVGFFYSSSTKVGEVFGIFDVDLVHNLIHLVSGVMGLMAALFLHARTYNRAFGVCYTLLGILGLIPALYFPAGAYGTDNGLFLGITHINVADHILHLIAGVLAIIVGFFIADYTARTAISKDTVV